MDIKNTIVALLIMLCLGCKQDTSKNEGATIKTNYLEAYNSVLNFEGTPKSKSDRNMLMFSDQGAWFAYSHPDSTAAYGGFSGPFLMTQENGVWISRCLAALQITDDAGNAIMDWQKDITYQNSDAGKLRQTFKNSSLKIDQELVFMSGHTALARTTITNLSGADMNINSSVAGNLFDVGIQISNENNYVKFTSQKSDAIGYVQIVDEAGELSLEGTSSYKINLAAYSLQAGASKEVIIAQTFIFPEYSWTEEQKKIQNVQYDTVLNVVQNKKEDELKVLIENRKGNFGDDKYATVLAKAHLTLQNNWRIPAGELKHQGLFPSYQYEWFHGFWSWDSWKHAVGLSYYNTALAKDQMRAMFDYQSEDGFIVDCIYRDTTIEAHNYRDTKPPLSAWAVARIIEKDPDMAFLEEMYPKLKKYHGWWYNKRDHDQDGLCEFGSTDGTVLAAKWESGMDNAIRFDASKILRNSEGAYSLDQESVDLNAYLYAEKLFLSFLAEKLEQTEDAHTFKEEAVVLKKRIQEQFYDEEDGWFYDTNLDGTRFIKGAGSEGWTALWARAATQEQAEAVKDKMMDPEKFYTKVPFQTMSKDHPKFDPLNGYWRGPNWLDQAYFGVKGLRNYGFDQDADQATIQIIAGAKGILGKGSSIRENYHPLSGEGLYAKNFSWSAAHLIMLLMEE
ncbi:MGH1-like glycoside hydrolase domain-containing protein [Muriicola sp. Z0-33]|uniref:MGH1-like glycoside hydrolase domain-containing protein n=1 Tax=Muriicola sp. Z0-33 TaxID=2816957 RepID=UPI0022379B12|nr:trehalase family glycosidase [Muriicola sp. Z0-33]MCW5516002.1 trehalase [Muriicola sp. Z0-33]